MLRQPLRTFLATLSLFLGCFIGGCSPAPLAHPAIIGASASAGFGCEITGPDGRPYLVDMEAVYQAIVPGWHSDPVFLADASFYTRARTATVEQMDAALAQNPSVIIAIDYLFWVVYATRNVPSQDDVERDRCDALEQALAQLDRFQGPVIVGDIPDMRASIGHMLSERNVPPPTQLEAFNHRIAAWAEQRRSRAAVAVLPVAALARAVEARTSVPTSCETLNAEAAASLLQPDHLHPTPTGLIVILREGLAGLAAQHVINPGDFRTDLAEIVARLPAEAAAADGRREPGLWTLLSVKGKLDDFNDAIEKKDCAKASDLFDQVMEKISRLKKSPHDFATIYVGFTLSSYRYWCKDSTETVRRWRDRLAPAIERPLPDPWPLTLWHEFNSALDEESRTVERAIRLKRANPTLPADYDDTLRSAATAACYADPAAYLELLPSWRNELDRNVKRAEEIADFWVKRSKTSEWPKEVEHQYKNALAFASDEEARQKIVARRAEFESPRLVIFSSRTMALDRIVALERALQLTGRTEDADAAHARVIQLADAEEATAAYERLEEYVRMARTPTKPKF